MTDRANINIMVLDHSVADAFYVFVAGKPQAVNIDDIRERLVLRRGKDGTISAEQFADTPLGRFDLEEFFYGRHGSLLANVPLVVKTHSSVFRILQNDLDPVERHLSFKVSDGTAVMHHQYFTVDAFGVIRSSDAVWTDEVFTRATRDKEETLWECYGPERFGYVYDSEKMAAFHSDAFGNGSLADRLTIPERAANEIRKAVRVLNSALVRNGVRMVFCEADDVRFISAANIPGWERLDGEAPNTGEYFEIPEHLYRDLGMPHIDVKYVGHDEFLVKKQKENA